MATIDRRLRSIFIGTVLWLIVFFIIGIVLYLRAEQQQAEREVIYLKARALAAQEQRNRVQQWQKRRREQELKREYNKGRIVDLSRPAQPAAAPKPAAK